MPEPLDFRQVKCPLNFVKTKLALERLPLGDVLEVWLSEDSESSLNVPNSLRQEGHEIIEQAPLDVGGILLKVKRLK
jgi:TusA-related sulfurtransferase